MLYRDETGRERARTPRGFMTDAAVDPASGDPAISFGVTYRLVPHGRATALEVSLDRAWLDDPGRAWPVTVDPSYYVTQSDHDTFVQHPYTADYSWWGELKVGTFNGGGDKARSFLRFPALDALDGKVIHSAQLKLFNFHSFTCSPTETQVFRVTQGWDGTNMRTYPGASYGEHVTSSWFSHGNESAGCGDGWASFDVVSAVRNWASNAWENHGLVLRAPSETDNGGWKKFNSFDAGGSSVPVVEVAWSEPASAPGSPRDVFASPRNGAALVTWAPPSSDGGSPLTNYILGSYVWNGSAWVHLNTA